MSSNGKHIAVGREPVTLFPMAFFIILGITMVKNLNLNARREIAWRKRGQRLRDGPNEDPRITSRTKVLPLGDEFKIFILFLRANDSDRLARAMRILPLPGPGIFGAIDVDKIFSCQQVLLSLTGLHRE